MPLYLMPFVLVLVKCEFINGMLGSWRSPQDVKRVKKFVDEYLDPNLVDAAKRISRYAVYEANATEIPDMRALKNVGLTDFFFGFSPEVQRIFDFFHEALNVSEDETSPIFALLKSGKRFASAYSNSGLPSFSHAIRWALETEELPDNSDLPPEAVASFKKLHFFVCGSNSSDVFESRMRKMKKKLDERMSDILEKFRTEPQKRNRTRRLEDGNTCIADEILEGGQGNFFRFIWSQIQPIVQGKILYYPENEWTRRIMERVQASWAPISHLMRILAIAHDDLLPIIYDMLHDEQLLAFLMRDTFQESVFEMLGLAGERDHFKKMFLYFEEANKTAMYHNIEHAIVDALYLLQCFEMKKIEPMQSEEELEEKSLVLITDQLLWGGIVFIDGNQTEMPPHVRFKIRMDSSKVDNSREVTDRIYEPGPRARPNIDLKYVTYGFAFLQDLVERAIIAQHSGVENPPGILLQQFPYPCFTRDRFVLAISRTFPTFMVLAWVYTAAMIIRSVVYEKEQRLKETMQVMGLSREVHWVAWFLTSFVLLALSALLLSLVLVYGNVTENSDPLVIFVFILCYGVATICLSFLISCLFGRANTAAAAGGMIFFCLFLGYPFLVIWNETLEEYQKLLPCLISNVAFGFGCGHLANWEQAGIGVHWNNIFTPSSTGDDTSLGIIMFLLLLDGIIYILLAWYLEGVFPGECMLMLASFCLLGNYGVPLPCCYPFMPSYWRQTSKEPSEVERLVAGEEVLCEPDPKTLKCGVVVQNLRKVYEDGKLAVDNLNLSFYEGQITAFLGHNGAGKTTTISIMTGLIQPTSGTATIYGRDICTDMKNIRHSMGVCPQHNVLFDLLASSVLVQVFISFSFPYLILSCPSRLTVWEHLMFYGCLKGNAWPEVEKLAEKMLHDLGIPEKRDALSTDLSGGMQRKLSVAIAFLSENRTVFLDEPTSGVDPFSRRAIWELLCRYKKGDTIFSITKNKSLLIRIYSLYLPSIQIGRTVILTTHHMDEAEILGDRIAILSQGKLKCIGSPLFLKTALGSGYTLRLVRKQQSMEDSAEGRFLNAAAAEIADEQLTEFLRKNYPDAQLVEKVGLEIIYLLPWNKNRILQQQESLRGSVRNPKMEREDMKRLYSLLLALDENLNELGISNYGISDTKLEEVFLKITRQDEEEEDVTEQHNGCMQVNGCLSFLSPQDTQANTSLARPKASIAQADGRLDSSHDQEPPTPMSFQSAFSETPFETPPSGSPESHQVANHVTPGAFEGNGSGIQPSFSSLPEVRIMSGLGKSSNSACFEFCLDYLKITVSQMKSGAELRRAQFLAIVEKRFHHSRRDFKTLFCQLVLPVLFITLALIFTLLLPPLGILPALEIHHWYYQEPNYVFFAEGENSLLKNPIVDEMVSRVGIGARDYQCESRADLDSSILSKPLPPVYEDVNCSCAIGSLMCPEEAGLPSPPELHLHTSDFLLNLTGRDVSQYLLWTHERYRKFMYGGFSFDEPASHHLEEPSQLPVFIEDLHKNYSLLNASTAKSAFEVACLIEGLLMGITPGVDTSQFSCDTSRVTSLPSEYIKVWFYNQGYLSPIAFMNAINNVVLRTLVAKSRSLNSSAAENFGISVYSHPILTESFQELEMIKRSGRNLLHAIVVIFALSFIPAAFVVILIEERISGSKHLQFVAGLPAWLYWAAALIGDLLSYAFSALLCVVVFLIFDEDAYVSETNLPGLVALFLLYGWASIPLMYPASFYFRTPSAAFVALACSNLFIGIITTISTLVLEVLEELVSPKTFAIPSTCERVFEWKCMGQNLTFLGWHGFLGILLVLLIEYRSRVFSWCYSCCTHCNEKEDIFLSELDIPEDEDVAEERKRVHASNDDEVLRIVDLIKVYHRTKKPAVYKICLGAIKGQCFGLLGVNGAGKTTTFKMLTGDISVTAGEAFVDGFSITKDLSSVQQRIGYCPQFDALDPLLTAREHLRLYANLRGFPSDEIHELTEGLIHRMNLWMHASRCAGKYSGGNKRKLSTAIALVGNPPVVFLDEPTTGMDPGARRFLWNCVQGMIKEGRCVILTSHSMEECEALCARLAIMVQGQFRCLGSTQHLKHKFGSGYTISLHADQEHISQVEQYISENLLGVTLHEKNPSRLVYHLPLPPEGPPLAKVFRCLEDSRLKAGVTDYSVSQTTLDEVFVRFASDPRFSSEEKQSEWKLFKKSLAINGLKHKQKGKLKTDDLQNLETLDESKV
ncbi:unnamed protein product [Darwinula stevensoni]|uniref:ABC transporter domain-containing protein n=1 Tax=Darwinula stevensoni TaxID=69355 RepID=A0A7R9A319_9CRUS|nr:unnamed protein product [Darwinula stevensoni]CAG0880411.1 unnamed protein product [Darwinula stevensoni]